jgi:septum formation protein
MCGATSASSRKSNAPTSRGSVVDIVQQKPLVLASASPRRKDILEQLGLTFRILPSGIDETALAAEQPAEHVERLARGKAAEIATRLAADRDPACILAADTIVVIDGQILGKPRDDGDALRMLRSLSGRTHRVISGVALAQSDGHVESAVFTTDVTFRKLDDRSARAYVMSGEGRDKAGSYAIQGFGAGLVTRVSGSYTNVVGLPAAETIDLLLRAGVLEAWP